MYKYVRRGSIFNSLICIRTLQQKDVAASKESSLKSLLKRDESAQSALEECHSLRQQLREAHRNLQWLENQLEDMRVELKRREDLVKGMKAEAATKNRRLQVLQENIRRKDLTIRYVHIDFMQL